MTDAELDEVEYTEGFWAGLPRFACAYAGCQVDTLHRDQIEAHVVVHRPPPPEPRPTGLVDEAGRPLMIE